MRVAVGDSCFCCCTCVTYFEGQLTPLCVDSFHLTETAGPSGLFHLTETAGLFGLFHLTETAGPSGLFHLTETAGPSVLFHLTETAGPSGPFHLTETAGPSGLFHLTETAGPSGLFHLTKTAGTFRHFIPVEAHDRQKSECIKQVECSNILSKQGLIGFTVVNISLY